MHYNIITSGDLFEKNGKKTLIQNFYYVNHQLIFQPNAILCILPTIQFEYHKDNLNFVSSPSLSFSTTTLQEPPITCLESIPSKKIVDLSKQVVNAVDLFSKSKKINKKTKTNGKTHNLFMKSEKLHSEFVLKPQFRIEWKNEYRNIVPNLMNQLMSFLLKKFKSEKLVAKIYARIAHHPSWKEERFYIYMVRIKDSVSHYVDHSLLVNFLQLHDVQMSLYSMEEQLFYLKVARIALLFFLKSQAIQTALTSNKMSSAKRNLHLIARRAVESYFVQLSHYVQN